jgi:hypothetical protein
VGAGVAEKSTGGEEANALVCKTSIRRFNSGPVLQIFQRAKYVETNKKLLWATFWLQGASASSGMRRLSPVRPQVQAALSLLIPLG